MNIQMRGAEEWIDGKATGNLGEVLIRYVLLCFGKEWGRRKKDRKGMWKEWIRLTRL
jgi:hypothetical protein